ncbi:hypothetical protein KP509_09G065200 [Ceratopteris richardii]|uniref:Cytochrome b5 heme-binding domain-containing protein n=1 Tax=Ceratopteris richardii TaxID=49495 RepID=A0A8T2U506_CERRI|nr:hypothetical protein KP509_09G065200 [Ceratopteris richardii]
MDTLLLVMLATILFAGSLIAIFLFPYDSKDLKQVKTRDTTGKETQQFFTLSEVSKHNQATDCWIIIKNKVYDVTSYVEEHPGGYAILNHAGGDSTEGFYGPQHASRVFDMVEEFYIGDLKL